MAETKTGAPQGGLIRPDGRSPGDLRPLSIQRPYLRHAEGSALVEAIGAQAVTLFAVLFGFRANKRPRSQPAPAAAE